MGLSDLKQVGTCDEATSGVLIGSDFLTKVKSNKGNNVKKIQQELDDAVRNITFFGTSPGKEMKEHPSNEGRN